MSLYALVQLFVQERQRFVQGFLLVAVIVLAFAFFQPAAYRTELVLSVTRTALAPTTEYAYDSYYRFSADERLAESLVQYLGSATGKRSIAERAALGEAEYDRFISDKLRIARRSANLVMVEYDTRDRATAERLGEALDQAANAYVVGLNVDARDPAWFTVVASEPVSRELALTPARLTVIALLGGLFAGFWAVLLQHFWTGYQQFKTQVTRNKGQV